MPDAKESDSRRKVRELHERGLTPREIAARLGMTTQNVYVHLTKMRRSADSAA